MLVIQSQFISAISFWVLLNDSEFKGSRAVAKKQFILHHHHRLGHSHGRHHNESSRLGSFNFFHNSFYTSLNWSEILILSIFSLVDCVNINDFEVEEEDHLPEFLYPYEFDIVSLYSHLEDECSCELKAIVRYSLDRFLYLSFEFSIIEKDIFDLLLLFYAFFTLLMFIFA